ncbi:MAG TPA: hypothetical protein VJQ47_13645 [Steroidobacteraceae bacterium]|nr:hypothetical protein [Steroidobacteraceae bacterium]
MRIPKILHSLITRVAAVAAVGLLALVGAPRAEADMVLTQQTNMVIGSLSEDFGFTPQSAGTVVATLTPLNWPSSDALSSLNFVATTTSSVIASFSALNTPSVSFDVTPGVSYFAHVLGNANPDLNTGLFSYTLAFTPSAVPLSASLVLLILGILTVGAACVFGPFSRESHAAGSSGQSLTA